MRVSREQKKDVAEVMYTVAINRTNRCVLISRQHSAAAVPWTDNTESSGRQNPCDETWGSVLRLYEVCHQRLVIIVESDNTRLLCNETGACLETHSTYLNICVSRDTHAVHRYTPMTPQVTMHMPKTCLAQTLSFMQQYHSIVL